MNENFPSRIECAKDAIANCDCILIGAGAGLSSAAGLRYDGDRFQNLFPDFIAKYQLRDMYSSGFHPFSSEEERWAYWARHIGVNRYDPEALPLYRELRELSRDHACFALTTNVDHQFEKAGFPSGRLFATQGDYGLNQCAKGCHDRLHENEELVRTLRENTTDCRIPSRLVPKCPVCGGPVDPHLRKDHYFVENADWQKSCQNYQHFLQASSGKRVVFLECGVGFNTPGIIRYPFENMVYANKAATLIRINRDHPGVPVEIAVQSISFREDMMEVMHALRSN